MPPLSQHQAFLRYLASQQKIVYKVCHAYCKVAEDRKDLAQEIILHLWKAFPKYDPAQRASTWTYRIALNVAISFYRKEGKRQPYTISLGESFANLTEDPYDAAEHSEQMNMLHQFINELNDLNKALMLLYLDQHSYKEIGSMLGITETNVASKISRIKQGLKKKFKVES